MQIENYGKALDELFDAILTLENREECYQFFDDLCTVNEIQSLSQRLQVAKMIKAGLYLCNDRARIGRINCNDFTCKTLITMG